MRAKYELKVLKYDINVALLCIQQQCLALVREFSCRNGEFDVATGLNKTNSFSITTEKARQARQTRLGAHDRGSLSQQRFFYRDRLLTMVKKKKRRDPWDLGRHIFSIFRDDGTPILET